MMSRNNNEDIINAAMEEAGITEQEYENTLRLKTDQQIQEWIDSLKVTPFENMSEDETIDSIALQLDEEILRSISEEIREEVETGLLPVPGQGVVYQMIPTGTVQINNNNNNNFSEKKNQKQDDQKERNRKDAGNYRDKTKKSLELMKNRFAILKSTISKERKISEKSIEESVWAQIKASENNRISENEKKARQSYKIERFVAIGNSLFYLKRSDAQAIREELRSKKHCPEIYRPSAQLASEVLEHFHGFTPAELLNAWKYNNDTRKDSETNKKSETTKRTRGAKEVMESTDEYDGGLEFLDPLQHHLNLLKCSEEIKVIDGYEKKIKCMEKTWASRRSRAKEAMQLSYLAFGIEHLERIMGQSDGETVEESKNSRISGFPDQNQPIELNSTAHNAQNPSSFDTFSQNYNQPPDRRTLDPTFNYQKPLEFSSTWSGSVS